MENRLQHLLLTVLNILFLGLSLSLAPAVYAQQQAGFSKEDIDSEFLELGANIGYINIEDFPSTLAYGFKMQFRASEDAFLQLDLVLAPDVDLSSAEKSQGAFFSGGDRDYLYYGVLVGYNLFQGEFFTSRSTANLSSFYIVGGVGETEFGNESSNTYNFGLGYKVAFGRNYIMNIDMRQYIYESSLIAENDLTSSTHVSFGFNYLF